MLFSYFTFTPEHQSFQLWGGGMENYWVVLSGNGGGQSTPKNYKGRGGLQKIDCQLTANEWGGGEHEYLDPTV